MAVGGVQLGVQILGDEAGLKASLVNAVAAADLWAEATEAAGVRAARGIELTGVAARQAEVAYAKMGLAVSKYAEDTVGAQAAAVRYESTVSGLYERQIAMANAAAAAQERASVKLQTSLMSTGRAMTTYVTLPLAAVGYASIKLATDFQASMTRVRTYAGASADEVQKMSKAILDNSAVLPQGPIKAAEALYHLESIGIRSNTGALEALKTASLAAGAGQANLTDATTALGGALVANIKGAQSAKEAMASLIAIAGQGNMTMQNLTDALGTGLLVKAGNVGISLKEVGAALDVLVDRGIPARRAATYLGTTFALMVAPSQAAKAAAEDLGISWEKMGTDLQKPNGLMEVLQMFHERVDAVGKTRGMRDVMDMFGRSRQSTGIQTLIESFNAPVSSYAQKLEQMDAGTRQAAERMAAYQQTAQYKMHSSLSILESDLIKVGDGAAPMVADALLGVAHSVDAVVNAFERLPAPMKDMIGGLAATLAIVGPVMLAVGGLMKVGRAMGNVMVELGMLPKAAVSTTGAADGMEQLAASSGAAAGGVREIGAAFATLPAAAREGVVAAAGALAQLPLEARVAAAEAGAAFAGFASSYRAEIADSAMQASVAMAEIPASARAATMEAATAFAALPEAAQAAIAEMRTTFGEAAEVGAQFSALPREAYAAAVEVGTFLDRIPVQAREAMAETIQAFAELPVGVRAAVAKASAESAEGFAEIPAAAREASAAAAASFSTMTAGARDAAVSISQANTEMEATTGIATDTAAAVRGVGDAFAQMATTAEESSAAASLALKGVGETAVTTEAEIAPASLGFRGLMGAGMMGLGRASMFGITGMIAGQMASSMIGGQAGHVTGDVLEGAGLGAAVGTIVPGVGNLVGAGVGAGIGGLLMGLKDIIHTGPSFTSQMHTMADSVQGFGAAARAAAGNITQLHSRLADLRVSRDQLQIQVKTDRAAYAQNPSRLNRDTLIADEARLQAYSQQISATNRQIQQQSAARERDLARQRKALDDTIQKTQDLSNVTEVYTRAGAFARVGDQWVKIGTEEGQAKNQADAYRQALMNMAENSKGPLQDAYYKLADIVAETGKIPNNKQVRIAVHTAFDDNTKLLFFGLANLGKDLNKDFQNLFKGLKVTAASGGGGPPPLNTQQAIQVALAKNPNDRRAIEAEIRYDNQQIAKIKKERDEGKIGNQQFVDLITKVYQDRAQMESQLKSLDKKSTGQTAAERAFEKKVRDDELLAKARLDMENGQYAAAQALLQKDKARLEMLLKEAKTADERLAVQRQLLEVEKAMKSKEGSFALSMQLQVAMARADALAALDPSLQGPSALQVKLAREAKAQAMKAINSHKLTMQGLIDAWNVVGQANAVLAQQAANQANLYHTVSTDVIADSIKGLSRAQEMQLREELAQRDAHRGSAPNDQGAAGSGSGSGGKGGGKGGKGPGQGRGPQTADSPGPDTGGTIIKIDGPMNFYGVQNVHQLEAELEKLKRQKASRAGGRR